MLYPDIIHHGAKKGVTGSCHELLMSETHSLLIDCGLFQGRDVAVDDLASDQLAIEFDLSRVLALVVTHVHIDHVGRIPYLLAAGFKGPILCSQPSAELLPIVLEDAFRLGLTRDRDRVDHYVDLIRKRIIALPYGTWFSLEDSEAVKGRIRLQRAGHILGSSYVEVDLKYDGLPDRRVVFSGDLGAPYAPLLPAPKPPERADVLVIESTYGDRRHEDRQHRRDRLQRAIERALDDRGTVLIPAFSIGRTQELLYELEGIIHQQLEIRPNRQAESASAADNTGHAEWPELPVILDSPLATRFTKVYRQFQPFWDSEALERVHEGRDPLGFEQLITVDDHADHQRVVEHLARTARPAIVLAASGMCSGGRIVNYLKAMLGDPRHNVLFVGFQAPGTPGEAIQTHGPAGGYVDLDGERYPIKAAIDSLGGYSAHADQQDLVDFVVGMGEWPAQIRIIHGDKRARKALADLLGRRYAEQKRDVELLI